MIHGPNLNMLGQREKGLYGGITLETIDKTLQETGEKLGVDIESFQSNSEGDIVTRIQTAKHEFDALVINPAAYTHTSVAIRDAILAVELPTVEVHLTNIYKREPFRQKSFISDVVVGTISGFGHMSYFLGVWAASELVKHKKED